MTTQETKMARLVELLGRNARRDGSNATAIANVEVFRESQPHRPRALLYQPYFIFVAQGRKQSVLDGTTYQYHAGQFLTVLTPMPVACEVVEASCDKPLLALAIAVERRRILDILLRMEQAVPLVQRAGDCNPSGIFTAPLRERLLDAAIRLMEALESPDEAAVVGEGIIDEIYFRILKEERGGALPSLLRQRVQIKTQVKINGAVGEQIVMQQADPALRQFNRWNRARLAVKIVQFQYRDGRQRFRGIRCFLQQLQLARVGHNRIQLSRAQPIPR